RFLALLTRSARGAEPQTIELDLSIESRNVPVQISLRSIRNADAVVHHMAVVDFTDTKRIEQQLQEALDNWHSLVQNVPDAIMTVDSDGRITFANRGLCGVSPHALIGASVEHFVSEEDGARWR